MFIRKTRKTNGVTQKVYEYLHLVESVRTAKGPRQRLILNLGDLDVPPSQYKALARRIEDILTGQESCIKLDTTLEKHARAAAEKLFRKRAEETAEESEPDYHLVDVNSFHSERSRSLGAEYLCHCIWEELGIDDFLQGEGVSENVLSLLETIVVGRCVSPGSERHTRYWAEKQSAIYELTGVPLRRSLNSYYRAGDRLYSHKESLERYLCTKERTLFSLDEKIVFLDLTNTYFEGEVSRNPKAKRGRSKQKRTDCKLLTLGLIIDARGFAKYSALFPGNQVEGKTLSTMIRRLEQKMSSSAKERTIVIDAGVATEENIQWLKENGYRYIAVNRGDVPVELTYTDMSVIREEESQGVKIEVKRFEDVGNPAAAGKGEGAGEKEIYLLCRSKKKQAKERGIRTRVEDLFLDRLRYYRAGLTIPYRTKKYVKVQEMVGRLKEKYSKAARLYEVEVIPDKAKNVCDSDRYATDILWKKKEAQHTKAVESEGCYILRTNRQDLEKDEEIWNIYIMLTQIERVFKSLKSHLGVQPNFHQTEDRADAHMFISVLAYHLVHIIEYRLRQKKDHRHWDTIRSVLSTHRRLTTTYQTKDAAGDRRKVFVRMNTRAEPEHKEIYGRLNLSVNPLPRKKNAGKNDRKIEEK